MEFIGNFFVVASQVVTLFLLMGVGFVMAQLGKLHTDGVSQMSTLVLYVVTGVVLGGAGVYQKLVDWAGSGATVPLTGFGYLLAKGVRKAVEEQGFLGALTGGVTAAAGGITAAIFFGFLVALLFKSKPKS